MLPFSAPFVFTFVSPFFNRQITFAHERSKVLKLVQHFGTRQKKRNRKMEKTFNCQPPLNITTTQIETFVPVIFNNSLVFHPPLQPAPSPPLLFHRLFRLAEFILRFQLSRK